MSKYCLSINVRSENRELLDNLMLTLESINGDISEVDTIEIHTADLPLNTNQQAANEIRAIHLPEKGLFLEKWLLPEMI